MNRNTDDQKNFNDSVGLATTLRPSIGHLAHVTPAATTRARCRSTWACAAVDPQGLAADPTGRW